jgi:hypothetical protein
MLVKLSEKSSELKSVNVSNLRLESHNRNFLLLEEIRIDTIKFMTGNLSPRHLIILEFTII